MAAGNLETHVWLSDQFSVPRDQLCFRQKGKADAWCTLGKGHAGPCRHTWSPDVRLYSAQEARR